MGFQLSIVSPNEIIYQNDNVDFAVVPAEEGGLGILKNHTPLLCLVKTGTIRVKRQQTEEKFKIKEGFLEVLPDKVTVLTSLKQNKSHNDNKKES